MSELLQDYILKAVHMLKQLVIIAKHTNPVKSV